MTEFEVAIKKAGELEDRVKHLYFQALSSDAGLVTLKLLFPNIELPKKTVHQYRGKLAVAIACVIVPHHPHDEWTVWLTNKKKSKSNFNFKFKQFEAIKMPGYKDVPWEFSGDHYFICSHPGDMPF